MPLPSPGTPWPPAQLKPFTDKMTEWDAWFVGDPDGLRDVYLNKGIRPAVRPRPGSLLRKVARWFWSAPAGTNDEPRRRIHVPIAADLCQASADLLFADPPTISSGNTATQDRIDEYVEDGLTTALAGAAEVTAALGGGYLRATWDEQLQKMPFVYAVDADAAWPEFRYGRLWAVTFWRRYKPDGRNSSIVFRHLERHELDPHGDGVIQHGLYEGTEVNLGRLVPLTELAATEALAEQVNENSLILTGSPGLAVTYVPNVSPQRLWRSDATGRHLGRSDLDGVEPLMDALDETYSSWMRDIDLGKGRITVPETMLDVKGPGKGLSFDLDREVYAGVNAGPSSNVGITATQFEIRVAEHKATAQQFVEDILRAAGYSQQTFGEDETGGAQTKAEVISKDRRSLLTRDRKIRHWKPAIRHLVRKMLAADKMLGWATGVDPEDITTQFTDGAQDSTADLAQTAQLLRTADAASTETLVRMVHPDWDDPAVNDEVGRIQQEAGTAAQQPDPDLDTLGA